MTPAKYPVQKGNALLMANKEKWLGKVATEFNEYFIKAGNPLPKLRAVCGFTSLGAGSHKTITRIGECWYPQGSEENHVEIFVSPSVEDSVKVVATLAHELCHAALGPGFGHGKEFGALARGLNLEGPLTATHAGPKFIKMVGGFVDKVGEMPKGKLDISGMTPAHPKNRKPQAKKTTLRCKKKDCEFEAIVKNELIDKFSRVICPVHGLDLLTPAERGLKNKNVRK